MEPTKNHDDSDQLSAAPVRDGVDAKLRILWVALKEFGEKGYDGATTAAIARAAGVTQPLIHYHFKNKEDLWRAVIDMVCSRLRLMDPGELAELRDLDPLSQLKVIARRLVSFTWKCPEFAQILGQEGVRGGPRFSYLADSLLKPMLALLEGALAKGQREGWLKPLPIHHLIFLWLGAASQLFAAPALARELGLDAEAPTTMQQYSDAYVEMMFHGLLTPRTATNIPEAGERPYENPLPSGDEVTP